MILVIIIAAAWIVILTPSLMKRRSQAVGEIGSISHFHRQLRVLEHSGPEPIVTPAYRLRSVDGSGEATPSGPGYPEVAAVPVLSVVGASQLPRPALAFLGEEPGGRLGRTASDPPPVRPIDGAAASRAVADPGCRRRQAWACPRGPRRPTPGSSSASAAGTPSA